jgi:hypothetical protein
LDPALVAVVFLRRWIQSYVSVEMMKPFNVFWRMVVAMLYIIGIMHAVFPTRLFFPISSISTSEPTQATAL